MIYRCDQNLVLEALYAIRTHVKSCNSARDVPCLI